MTTQQLKYVLTLAETKSFSMAAKRLYITQPALSLYIMNLEVQLGVNLFDRSSSPIKLTSVGEEYIKTAQKILDLEAELNNKISDILQLKQGLLSVGVTPIRGSYLIADALALYNQKYPGIKINMIEYEMSKLQDSVLDGSIDFFIGNAPIQNNLLTTNTIGTEHLFLAVPKNNPNNKFLEQYQVPLQEIINNKYTARTPVDFSIFSNDPFIVLQPNQRIHTLMLDLCNNSGFEPTVVLQTNKLETAYSVTQKGLGSTIVSDTLIRHAALKEHPVYYALPEKSSVRNIIVVYKKNRYISHMAEEFISILKKNLV